MIAVIFELRAAAGQRETYLELAAELKPLLSLSFWRDEAAVQQWRNLEQHRQAQARGRHEVLEYYRLRVAEVVRDYGLEPREQAPADSRHFHG